MLLMNYPNKTEDLIVFDMIAGTNESKILTQHVSYECQRKFEDKNATGTMVLEIEIKINSSVNAKIEKKILHVKKVIFGILLHPVVKIVNV